MTPKPDAQTRSYALMSAAGGALVIAICLLFPADGDTPAAEERWAVGLTFIAACTLGVSLALRPGWHKWLRGGKEEDVKVKGMALKSGRGKSSGRRKAGHHPDCEPFRDHTIVVGGRTRCAGCTGLAIGCAFAAVLMALRLWRFPGYEPAQGWTMVLVGFALVAYNMAETAGGGNSPVLHMSTNALLVPGFYFVTAGALQLTALAGAGFTALLVCILWLETRMRLSGWRHRRICVDCGRECRVD